MNYDDIIKDIGTGGDTKIVYCYEIGPNTKERE